MHRKTCSFLGNDTTLPSENSFKKEKSIKNNI